jgi:hypothetical protein
MTVIQSETTKEIFAALAKAQPAIPSAVKDSENPHFKSKYADLTSVWAVAREPLSANGLSIVQEVTAAERGVAVMTQINHVSGEWVRLGPLVVPMDRPTAHGTGSAISYGKRYALAAALGITAEEDDDGNAASEPERRKEPPPARAAAKPDPPQSEATERLRDILKNQIGCPRERGDDLFDAATAGRFRPVEINDPEKAPEILRIFEEVAETLPYSRWVDEIGDLLRHAGMTKELDGVFGKGA